MPVFDCGSARKVLALHCSLAHGGAWAGVAAGLTGVTLMAPDLPGHGSQPLWDGVTDLHRETTRQTIDLAEAEGAVDLVGHSFGATVALRVALERPELVRSLTLIEPVLFAAARADESTAFRPFVLGHKAFADLAAAGQMERAAQVFMSEWGDGTAWGALPARQRRYIIDRIAQVAAQDAVLLEDSAGLLGFMRLEALGLPVLLLEGERSPPIVAAIQSALADRLPQMTRAVVAGAGHMLPITHAAKVASLMQAHFDRVDQST